MGNCCTRVKEEQKLEQESKQKKTKNDENQELREKLSEIISNTEEMEMTEQPRKQSFGASTNALSKHSFQKNSIEQQLLNKQFQEFQNRIYEDKMRETDIYMKLMENSYDEMSNDQVEQIQNFQNSMEFLLNFPLFCQSQTSQKINNLNFKYSKFLLKYFDFSEKQFRASLKIGQTKKQIKDDSEIQQQNLMNSPPQAKIASSIDLDTNKSLNISEIDDSVNLKSKSIDLQQDNQLSNENAEINKMLILEQIRKCVTLNDCLVVENEISKVQQEKQLRIDNLENFDIIAFLCEGKRILNNINEEINEYQIKEKIDEQQIQFLQKKKLLCQLMITNVVQKVDSLQQDLARDIKKTIFEKSELGQDFFKMYYKKIANSKESIKFSYQNKPSKQDLTSPAERQAFLEGLTSPQETDDNLLLGVIDSPHKNQMDNIMMKLKSMNEKDKQNS